MKKLLFFASVLFAGMMISCQQESLEPATGDATVTFTVSVPDVAVKGVTDDGSNINDIVYAVYKTDGETLEEAQTLDNGDPFYQVNETSNASFVGGKSVVSLELINNQNYIILFWAQVNDAWVKAGDDFDLTNITYPANMSANNDDLAAFSGVAFIDNVTGGLNKSIELTRPFAQINLATKMPVNYTVELDKSSMTVEGAAQSFNAMTQAASTATADLDFDLAVVPGGEFKTGYQYVGMNYIFVNGNVEVGYTIDTKEHGTGITHTVPDVPVAKNYRTNIIGNLLTSVADYEITLEEEFGGSIDRDPYTFYVTSDVELEEALSKDIKDIVIDLSQIETKSSAPMTYNIDVDANNEKYYIGGEKTRTITINANGNTINFIHNNTDWNYIRCVSDDAKWIINDAALTNSGANNGPWNRHDIRFYNAVELNNVTSDKAIALLNDGKLTNVQISDVYPDNSEAYGLWITAEGQTVSLDGVTITPSEGKTTDRAIKIADQYVDSPAKVTLNVSNSKFVSQKKAAILVTSTAGADINWGEGNDIKGVAADPINAVWVDEDRAQYASEVKVEGASKVVEGAVDNVAASNQEKLNEALAAAAQNPETTMVVNVAEGTYTFPTSAMTPNVVLNCAEGTVFEGTSSLDVKGATVIGATFENDGIAVRGTVDGTFKNCTFDGSEALRWCYTIEGDEILFEDCVINTDFRGFHFDNMAGNVTFRRCEINGFNAFGGEGTATFENCVFGNDESSYNGLNIYSNTVLKDCQFVFNSGKTNFIDMEGTGKTLSITNCTATLDGTETPVIDFVGGSKLANNTVILDGKTYASSNASLLAALQNGATNILLKAGNYEFAENPTIAANEVVIEGSDRTACVLKISKQLRADNKSLTLKNLTTDVPTGLGYSEHTFAWIHYFNEFNMVDCNSNGRIRLNSYSANIEGCNFDVTTSNGFDGYGIYYYGPKDSNVKVKNCVFTTVGKAIVMYNEGNPVLNLDVEGCTFTSSATTDKAAIQMHTELGISGTLDITKCTATGFADVNGGLWNELNNNTKVPTYNFTITVDGETVQEAGWAKVNEGVYNKENEYKLTNATGLFWFANELNVNGNTFAGKTVKLTTDIDLENAVWTPVGQTGATQFQGTFDGQNMTISNLNVDATAQTGGHYSSGLFGWLYAAIVKNVKVDGATVKGNHNVGVIGGYLETSGCTIENCHVTNAAVECHVANSDANGDKCGVIVGHAGNAGVVVKDCTAAESTVSAGRDAGQIVGAAKEANVTGCSATNVTVTANGEGNGTNIRNEVIGRIL